MYKKLFLIIVAIVSFCFANATNYYVSTLTGNDGNKGLSAKKAFLTLQAASDGTLPGDTVFIMNGTYSSKDYAVLNIRRSGSKDAQIVYTKCPGHSPLLQGSPENYAIIFISPAISYITINGLEIVGYAIKLSLALDTIPAKAQLTCPDSHHAATEKKPLQKYNAHGITADSRKVAVGSHHIVVSNNTIHDNSAGGIAFLNCDYITIEGNTVYNNTWYTIYGTSGISFNEFYNYDNDTIAYRNIIRNNISYGNRMYVPFHNDCRITDGNGIILDIPKKDYRGKSLVANNICFNNGGSGIHTFRMNHVDIVHNISYLNSASPEINSSNIYALDCDDVNICNNIIVARPGKRLNGVHKTTNLIYDYNILFGGSIPELSGKHNIIGDPQFVYPSTNPKLANFKLKAGSPAINKGDNNNSYPTDFIGLVRPTGNKVDIGAYEFPVVKASGKRIKGNN